MLTELQHVASTLYRTIDAQGQAMDRRMSVIEAQLGALIRHVQKEQLHDRHDVEKDKCTCRFVPKTSESSSSLIEQTRRRLSLLAQEARSSHTAEHCMALENAAATTGQELNACNPRISTPRWTCTCDYPNAHCTFPCHSHKLERSHQGSNINNNEFDFKATTKDVQTLQTRRKGSNNNNCKLNHDRAMNLIAKYNWNRKY